MLTPLQTREAEPIHLPNEGELLEVISQADSVYAIFNAAYHALDDTVGAVMQNVLHKNDSSVRFIVDSLMAAQGPLGDIMVRAGLLLGLGFMPREIYTDIQTFVHLKEYSESKDPQIDFTDSDLLAKLRKVETIKQTMPIDYDPSMLSGLSESMLKMFTDRHNQKVQSTIVLAITNLVEAVRRNHLTL